MYRCVLLVLLWCFCSKVLQAEAPKVDVRYQYFRLLWYPPLLLSLTFERFPRQASHYRCQDLHRIRTVMRTAPCWSSAWSAIGCPRIGR